MRVLQSPGPVNWEVARQVAGWVALGGGQEAPVDGAAQAQFDELARAAQTHVVAETGLASTFAVPTRTIGRQAWAELHLDALRPVLTALATNLGRAMQEPGGGPLPGLPGEEAGGADPFAGLVGMLAPALLGLQAGSMIGHLATHALGRYDLPLPTSDDPSLCFVVANVDAFEEAWSLPRDDLRFAVALHEVVHAAERSVPWVRDRLVALATRYVSGYELDEDAFEARFGRIDPADPSSFSEIAADPATLVGAMQTPAQREVLADLQALVSVLAGYADDVLRRVGRRLIGSFDQIQEALQRHRLEQGEAGRFVELLLGVAVDREHYERGSAFCAGVVEREGPDALNRLWEGEAMLPTRSELEAPGLWLARIDMPA